MRKVRPVFALSNASISHVTGRQTCGCWSLMHRQNTQSVSMYL